MPLPAKPEKERRWLWPKGRRKNWLSVEDVMVASTGVIGEALDDKAAIGGFAKGGSIGLMARRGASHNDHRHIPQIGDAASQIWSRIRHAQWLCQRFGHDCPGYGDHVGLYRYRCGATSGLLQSLLGQANATSLIV